MALRVVNQGEQIALEALFNKVAPQDTNLILFQNDVAEAETNTEADLTVATFTGYAAIQLTASSWTYSHPNLSYPQQTFTSTAGSQNQTIYGCAVVQRTSGKLIYLEKFASPITIVNNQDKINVTLNIGAD